LHMLFLTVVVFPVCGGSCMATEKPSSKQLVGGPCQYKEYPGRAVIISVKKMDTLDRPNATTANAYEVKFSFTPDEEIEEDWVRVEGKEHQLLLANSTFPRPGFLKKYGIEPGKCFECYVKVITRGTCTPVLFDFPTIDLSDYSERE
jgi:hypothetical protein